MLHIKKADFLKKIIQNQYVIEEISVDFAFELLANMKGGPSIKVLIDIALGDKVSQAKKSS